MSETLHSVRVVARGYELGRTGQAAPAAILRWMEHSRWEAMASKTFVAARFWKRGVLRAERIAIVAPIAYSTELEIRTWIGRIGRTSFEFVHRAVRVSDGAELAVASAVGVLLDESGKPKAIDESAREAIVPEPGPVVPDLDGAPPADAFTREILVGQSDLDVLQHVNHARWVDFAEDTRFHAGASASFGGEATRAARRLSIEFQRQAVAGERLVAHTWQLSEPECFGVELRLASGETCARARIET